MSARKGGGVQIQYGDRIVQNDQIEVHRFSYPYCMVDGGQHDSNGDGRTLIMKLKRRRNELDPTTVFHFEH